MARLLVLLMGLVGNAWGVTGGWTRIDSVVTYGNTYIGLGTIVRIGEIATAWTMLDFNPEEIPESERGKFLSQRFQYVYNCRTAQQGFLFAISYSGNKGEGEIIHTGAPPFEWQSITLGTGGEQLFNIVCREKLNER